MVRYDVIIQIVREKKVCNKYMQNVLICGSKVSVWIQYVTTKNSVFISSTKALTSGRHRGRNTIRLEQGKNNISHTQYSFLSQNYPILMSDMLYIIIYLLNLAALLKFTELIHVITLCDLCSYIDYVLLYGTARYDSITLHSMI